MREPRPRFRFLFASSSFADFPFPVPDSFHFLCFSEKNSFPSRL